MQEESKTNAGSVEAIQEHPDDSNKVRAQISDAVILLQIMTLCDKTVNLKTHIIYYSTLKLKYSPFILKHNKGIVKQ